MKLERFEVFECDNNSSDNNNNNYKNNKQLSIVEKLGEGKLGIHSSTTFLSIHWDNSNSFNNNNDYIILSNGKPKHHKDFLNCQSFFTNRYSESYCTAITDHQLKCIDESEDYHVSYCSAISKINRLPSSPSHRIEEVFSFKEYSQWMSLIWDKIKHKKVRELVLPGSHDAATYKINSNSERSPDYRSPGYAPNLLITKWSITQSSTIYKQLLFGVRYFDLRVAPTSTGELKVHHNLFSVPIVEVIDDIARFIKDKREILILHWNHLEFLSDSQHQELQLLIKSKLGYKMASRDLGVDVTVDQLKDTPIITIYDDRFNVVKENVIQDHILDESCFWYYHSLRSAYDYHQYHSCESVISFLEKELEQHEYHSTFWVLQCVLTVDNNLSNLYQLVFDSVFDWTISKMDEFLKLFKKMDSLNIPTNIIMTDFVTFYPLTRYCINRNLK